MNYLVGYYVNLNLSEKFFGYTPGDEVKHALDLPVVATSAKAAAEVAFEQLQRIDGTRPSERKLDKAKAPSMSIGDVVLVGPLNQGMTGEWFAVARLGFDPIDEPNKRLGDQPMDETLHEVVERINKARQAK